ncbi:hypothetical protein KEM54_000954 [Ascosphaera aggregata]|nr:hypothetical protein KEM54_000954 [Ascosphaera aggregata]
MFYESDLQSGIALAVRENRSVVCFICDDEEENASWGCELFGNEEKSRVAKMLTTEKVSSVTSSSAIVFRLQSGSQESEYLQVFCPINVLPTTIVIRDGQVKDILEGRVAQEEAKKRVIAAISTHVVGSVATQATESTTTTTTATPSPRSPERVSLPRSESSLNPQAAAPEVSSSEEQPQPSNPTCDVAQSTEESANGEEDTRFQRERRDNTARQEQSNHQRREKQKEKEYRAQVLARIKADHEERRQRREIYHQSQLQTQQPRTTPCNNAPSPHQPHHTTSSTQIRLQIRLPNGTPLRNTFLPTDTIQHHVRPWLESQSPEAASTPYNLRLILTPQPSRQLSVVEEGKPLNEIDDLVGSSSTTSTSTSASLVMTPVRSYSSSYQDGSRAASWSASSWTALPLQGINAGWNLIGSAVGATANGVGRMLGIGRDPENGGLMTSEEGRGRERSRRDDRDEREVYNGNSLDFEYPDDRK